MIITITTTSFNIQNLCTLPTEYIYSIYCICVWYRSQNKQGLYIVCNKINWLVIVVETRCVLFEVVTEFLRTSWLKMFTRGKCSVWSIPNHYSPLTLTFDDPYCAVLCCAVSHYIALHNNTLHHTILPHYTILYYTTLYCTIPYYTIQYYTIL
jgi:hypothetical protein